MIEFPKTDNEMINDLWSKYTSPLWEKMLAKRDEYQSFQPPSPAKVSEFLKSCTDDATTSLLEDIDDLERQVNNLKEKATEHAINSLTKASNPDQILATKQSFNSFKKSVLANLKTISIEAEHQGLEDAYSAAKALSESLPTLSASKSVKNDLSQMRAWLKEKGHKVSDRGRIPNDLQDLFNNRSK